MNKLDQTFAYVLLDDARKVILKGVGGGTPDPGSLLSSSFHIAMVLTAHFVLGHPLKKVGEVFQLPEEVFELFIRTVEDVVKDSLVPEATETFRQLALTDFKGWIAHNFDHEETLKGMESYAVKAAEEMKLS